MSNHNNSIDESQQAERANSTEQPQPSEQQAQSAEQPQLSGQTGVIYKITCLVNGKGYVGQTRQKLEVRIRGHKNCKVKRGIDAAIRKYGFENFTVEVLEICHVELLDEREIFFIRELGTKAPNGYNLTDGGDGGSNPSEETRAKISTAHKGKKLTPETRAKLSAAHKGKSRAPLSQETRAKISASRKGIHHSEETRARLSTAHTGKKHTPETLAKMSAAQSGKKNGFYGKHHSQETREKISANERGKTLSDETKAKIAATLTGIKRSPETCAKMSAARKGKKGKPHTPETKAKIAAALKAAWARRKKAVENGGK